MAIVLISATRSTEATFCKETFLGQSLERLSFDPRIRAMVAYENSAGLPQVYNAGLRQCAPGDIAVFLHDDVTLDDYYLSDRLIEATQNFDIVGCVGNRRRCPNQPGWGFLDINGTWDDRTWLSGSVAHGSNRQVTLFGPSSLPCELLDGFFIAARVDQLRLAGISFDPRFKFHMYDMDFCRSARSAGLRLGTWPIVTTHASTGNFGSHWREAVFDYFGKWGD